MERCGGYHHQQIHGGSTSVVCPQPRRIRLLNPAITDHIRPSKCRQTDVSDSRARAELFDMMLTKGEKTATQVASSPPYFIGSPPSRVSNPIIEDSRFGCVGSSSLSPKFTVAISPSSSGCRGGSCARTNYGNNPVTVRIEGFSCFSRDCANLSAVA